jgi:hypothetical protein
VRIYPDLPGIRLRAVGLAVYHTVDSLSVLGRGVHDSGAAVQNGFDSAAHAVDGIPLVGGELADGLKSAGEGTGGNVAELGQKGEDRVHRTALVLGLTTFGLPAIFLLAWQLPPRVGRARRLNAAHRALSSPEPEAERLVAMRAAFSLPYGELLSYTPDPFGDLAAGRHEALVRAAFADAGLRPRSS